MRLPSDDAPPRERYTMPDPDGLSDAYQRLREAAYHDTHMSRDDVKAVLMLAEGYLGLTTYEMGQECCVAKLRDIWRARRRRA
jgi:hypothetical protein